MDDNTNRISEIKEYIDKERENGTPLHVISKMEFFDKYNWPNIARLVLNETEVGDAKKNYKYYTMQKLHGNVRHGSSGMLLFLHTHLPVTL